MSAQAVSSPVVSQPGAFTWKVILPPTRDRSGKVIDIPSRLIVRGLTQHEASEAAGRVLGRKLPQGTQITRVWLHEAMIDVRPAVPKFSLFA